MGHPSREKGILVAAEIRGATYYQKQPLNPISRET